MKSKDLSTSKLKSLYWKGFKRSWRCLLNKYKMHTIFIRTVSLSYVEIIENYTYRVTNAISCSCWTMWSGVTPSAGWFWGRGWGRGWWGPGAVASVWPTSGGIALGVTYAIPRHTGAMIGIIPPDTALGYWGIVRGVPLWFGCWFVSYHGRWTGCSCLWSVKKKDKDRCHLGGLWAITVRWVWWKNALI